MINAGQPSYFRIVWVVKRLPGMIAAFILDPSRSPAHMPREQHADYDGHVPTSVETCDSSRPRTPERLKQ